MSFVIFAGCQYFGIMLGDRRCSNDNGEIINENAEKIKRINKNLVIGAGGDEALIDVFYRNIQEANSKQTLSYNECVDLVKNKFENLIPELHKLESSSTHLSMNMGIFSNVSNIITFSSIDVSGTTISINEKTFSSENDIAICYMAVGLGGLRGTFYDLFKKNGSVFSLSGLKSVFYQTLKKSTKTDYTINDRFSCEFIVRSDIYDEKRDRSK